MALLKEVESLRDHLKSISQAQKYDNPEVLNQVLDDFESLLRIDFTPDIINSTKIILTLAPYKTKPKNADIKKKAVDVFNYIIEKKKANAQHTPKRSESEEQFDIEKFAKNFTEVLKKGPEAESAKIKPSQLAKEIVEKISQKDNPKRLYAFLINCLNDPIKNEKFRLKERLLNGELSPADFASMTEDDLTTDEMKEKINQMRQENMDKAMVPKPPEAVSAFFRCRKCKSNRVTFFQLQTRSADEPMTNFCTCLECGNEWREY
ncbi:hypothetical protein TRFO_17733 [Tritrichomonas foetus]|uniref:Transcription elongation factor S-II n=1 Tax=Tritrichomonas foetus TaxID=1144522 RepID=A0A1J4KSK3_9EUKA|nr:hypothetical protein TRFO_17733 [Tritrichomonas foetus]|eukprot:OHT12453.1 hypothetical protein TRFO_17733 [Tritrichomonas foetus]